MFPFDLWTLFGAAADAVGSAVGWTFDKLIEGLFHALASTLALLLEWVWGVLDKSSRPRVLEPWFASGLVARLAPLSLAVIVAMMLANGISAGFGGRPDLVGDTIREVTAALVSTAVALTVIDVLLQLVEAWSGFVWQLGRTDLVAAIENWMKVSADAGLGGTFLGPLGALLGIVGVLVCAVVLFMRSTLIYVIAAVFPIVRATAVSPMFRASTRKLVHVAVALILAPFVITLTLVVAVKLMGNAPNVTEQGQLPAFGTMLTGFLAFAVAGISPWVLYRVMPTIEAAGAATGIASGWGRSAMTGAQAAMMAKSAGATRALSAATKPIAVAATGSTSAPTTAGRDDSSSERGSRGSGDGGNGGRGRSGGGGGESGGGGSRALVGVASASGASAGSPAGSSTNGGPTTTTRTAPTSSASASSTSNEQQPRARPPGSGSRTPSTGSSDGATEGMA